MRRPGVVVALLLLTAACSVPTITAATSTPVAGPTDYVVSVTDGDTFRTPGGPVRVLGIDTPETYGTDECYGKEATAEATRVLAAQEVLLVPDPAEPDRDQYNRRLRYVTTAAGEDFGAYMVRKGFARVYEQYKVTRTAQYLELQAQAQDEGRGLWSAC